MYTLYTDIRFALRRLRNAPGFTATAVLTLALGIGANTAIFTLVHAVLLRNLPVPEPERILRVGQGDDCCIAGGAPRDQKYSLFSLEMYDQFKANAPEFEQLAAVAAATGNGTATARRAGTNDNAQPQRGFYVSGNFFQMLGLAPAQGRLLTPSDDRQGATPVAVMSYATWAGSYQSDPTIVGSSFLLDSKPVTIIGITPAGFYGDRVKNDPPDFFLPISSELYFNSTPFSKNPRLRWLYLLGRVKPGVNVPALQAKLNTILRNYLATRPAYQTKLGKEDLAKVTLTVGPGGMGIEQYQSRVSASLHTLMGVSALVLLIACANIANLLLARGLTRRAETAVRLALGAARRRLIRQSLTESFVLSVCGAALGIALAFFGTRMILLLAFPNAHNLPINASPSLPVLVFTFALTAITAFLFGAAPAWAGSATHPAEALRGNNRSSKDSASLPRRALVILQATLSLVLLTVAGLLTRSLGNALHQDFGFQTDNRLIIHIDPTAAGYESDRIQPLMRQLSDRMLSIPGVKQVGFANYSPLEGNAWGETISIQGHPKPPEHADNYASWDRFTPGFIALTGQHLLRGRDFAETDRAGTAQAALVNDSFVKKFLPGEDPIGRHFGTDGDDKYPYEIIGVVADAKFADPSSRVVPMFFRSITQINPAADPKDMGERLSGSPHSILVLTAPSNASYEPQLRHAIAETDPNLAVADFATFGGQIAAQLDDSRLIAQLTLAFAVLALVLASIGLYGVTAYTVAQRIPEIGLRMALGSTRGNVIVLVLRGAMIQSVIGLAIGIPAALLAGHFLEAQLFGVKGYDPLTLTLATFVLAACAFIASLLPATRAASIEPTQALRTE